MKIGFIIIGLVLMVAGLVYAYDNHDFQIWNIDAEEAKINKDLKVALEEEFRWGDNSKEFYYHHYDAGLFYDLSKYLNVGGGYRRVFLKTKGKFRAEDEPYITATLFRNLAGFKFDDRSRLEYQYFDYQDDSFRYRNKLTVKLPWKFTKLQIQPFLSDEIFIRFDDSAHLNQNRFSCGLGMNLAKNLKTEIYYLLQNSRSVKKWPAVDVLGAKLKILF